MSLLDDLLSTLEARVETFAVCKVERGWSLALEGLEQPLIHYGLTGTGLLTVANNPPLAVGPNDFIIVPAGHRQRLDGPDGPGTEVRGLETCTALADGVLAMVAGSAADVVTVCGTIQATLGWALDVFDRLDRPIRVSLGVDEPLRHAFEAMLAELASPAFGSRALANALLQQCLILFARRLIAGGTEVGWLVDLIDPRLSRPVMAMLEDPAGDHALPSLAAMAGMSRSGFAAHFTAAFGRPPMEFLKTIRLHYAAHLLEATGIPISVIARSVGFESRSHFSRTFRAAFGQDPKSYRRDHRPASRRITARPVLRSRSATGRRIRD